MLSISHLLIVLLLVLVLFGAGKLPQVMGDLGRGVRALKDGLKEDEKKKLEDDSEKK